MYLCMFMCLYVGCHNVHVRYAKKTMYVCMCVYQCRSVCIHAYAHVLCVCNVPTGANVSLCVCMHVTFVCIYACVYAGLFCCLCICVPTHVCMCVMSCACILCTAAHVSMYALMSQKKWSSRT